MAEPYVKVSDGSETEMTEAKKSPKAAEEKKDGDKKDGDKKDGDKKDGDKKYDTLKPEKSEKGLNRSASSIPGLNKQKSKATPKNNKDDLDAQTKAFSDKNNIISMAYGGRGEDLFAYVDKNGWESLQTVGPVGDCPFLILFLIHSPNHLAIARECILKYNKELIYSQYQAEWFADDKGKQVPKYPLYWGETALHLAVVNKNEALLDELLTIQKELHADGKCLDKNLLDMPAKGSFFAPPLSSGPCYYGEVPLGFAACTANVSMCKKLLQEWGANLFFEDGYKNNLLHLLALHNLPDMYKFVLNEEKNSPKSKEPGYVPLSSRKNKEGFTPLAVAACNGNKEAFGVIIDSSKVTVWTYGPIEMIKFPLTEIDTLDLVEIDKIKNPPKKEDDKDKDKKEGDGDKGSVVPSEHEEKHKDKHKDKHKEKHKDKDKDEEPERVGIIELLIREGQLDLLMQNVLLDVLDAKWTRYAFRRYLMRCLKQSVLVFSVTLSLILGYPDPVNYPFDDVDTGFTSGFRILFELIVVYMICLKGFSEAGEMYNAGIKDYYGDVGVAFLENALSSSYCFTILLVVIIRIVGIVRRAHFIEAEGPESVSVFGDYSNSTMDADGNPLEYPSMVSNVDIFFQCLAVLLVYLYAITLLLGFRLTGQFVIMISKMLKKDVARFCLVYVVMWLGFATALLALQNVAASGKTPETGWGAMYVNMEGLFELMLGTGDISALNDGVTSSWAGFFSILAGVLVITYVILISIMLLNLLIAMMGDTYGVVKGDAEKEYIQYKAQIVMSLENEMGDGDWKSVTPYWIMDNGMPWLQTQIKNQSYLQMNAAGAALAAAAAAAPPPPPAESEEKKFKRADLDGDGKLSKEELAAFEASIREKVQFEFLTRLAQSGGLKLEPQQSLYANPNELEGGFRREGVFRMGENP